MAFWVVLQIITAIACGLIAVIGIFAIAGLIGWGIYKCYEDWQWRKGNWR